MLTISKNIESDNFFHTVGKMITYNHSPLEMWYIRRLDGKTNPAIAQHGLVNT